MKIKNHEQAAEIFAQLGNLSRLAVIRTLVQAGEGGLRVGEIQHRVNIPASTLSHHLRFLRQVGLMQQTRQGVELVCTLNFQLMHAAIEFLTENCCCYPDGIKQAS